MQFIYQYPDTHGTDSDMLDCGDPADVAVAAEKAGFGGFAFTEHPAPGVTWLEAGGHQSLDPLVALAHVAAVTTRIRLLTYLTVVPYRNPMLLAKAAATVDKLSKGRLILGVGTGYLKGEFRALGVDFDERNALFDEALDVLPLHWSGEPFSYQGRHFSARDNIGRPTPVQNPIPIWIGGNAAVTRRRVAERAQGWMPLGGTGALLTTTRTPAVAATLEDLGVHIAEVKAMAGERADALDFALALHVNDPTADIEQTRDRIGHMADVGLTWVIMPPPKLPPTQTLEWIEATGELYV